MSWDNFEEQFALAKQGFSARVYPQLYMRRRAETLPDALHSRYGWIIYYYLTQNLRTIDILSAKRALMDYLMLKSPRPSLLHSQMLSAAILLARKAPHQLDLQAFLRLWEISNLREEDFTSPKSQADSFALFDRLVRQLSLTRASFLPITELFAGVVEEGIVLERCSYTYYHTFRAALASERYLWATRDLNEYLTRYQYITYANRYHSSILKLLFLHRKGLVDSSPQLITWILQWGLQNFQSGDWLRAEIDSTIYPSLVEVSIDTLFQEQPDHNSLFSDAHVVEVLAQGSSIYQDNSSFQQWKQECDLFLKRNT